MKKILYHAGIDVDDKNFHVALINSRTKELIEFKCYPNVSILKDKLISKKLYQHDLRFCYEASYSGFDLYRQLKKKEIFCEVIAPNSIPKKSKDKVKTDKLDSRKLAEYYSKDLLTVVNVPDEEDEIIRDIIRARKLILEQLQGIRKHFLALCRRAGLHYRKAIGNPNASHWTQRHYQWLARELKKHNSSYFKFNITTILETCIQLERQISQYNQHIEEISQQTKYKDKVNALKCFKGLDTLSSMTLVSEIGDIRRFSHPSKLPSFAGMDITERSSGGKERRFRITKNGNRHIRTTVIEACQFAFSPVKISRMLQKRREGIDEKYIEIADRCMHRLKKKSNRLLFKGKPKNKIKVACARELLCFVWEALQKVA